MILENFKNLSIVEVLKTLTIIYFLLGFITTKL